jgi:hypothetical protein
LCGVTSTVGMVTFRKVGLCEFGHLKNLHRFKFRQ